MIQKLNRYMEVSQQISRLNIEKSLLETQLLAFAKKRSKRRGFWSKVVDQDKYVFIRYNNRKINVLRSDANKILKKKLPIELFEHVDLHISTVDAHNLNKLIKQGKISTQVLDMIYIQFEEESFSLKIRQNEHTVKKEKPNNAGKSTRPGPA